jgi:hypothetical protein
VAVGNFVARVAIALARNAVDAIGRDALFQLLHEQYHWFFHGFVKGFAVVVVGFTGLQLRRDERAGTESLSVCYQGPCVLFACNARARRSP